MVNMGWSDFFSRVGGRGEGYIDNQSNETV